MKAYRFLLGLAVLSVALFVVSIRTEAKVLNHNKITNPSVIHDKPWPTKDAKQTNRRASPKEKIKTLRNISKACNCNCTMPQELGGFGSCFGSCLQNLGVSSARILACTGLCVAAATGNPFGIVACVTCLGVTQWTVEYCGMKCAWGNAFAPDTGAEAKTRSQRRNNKRAPASLGV